MLTTHFIAADDVTKLLKEVGVAPVKEDLDIMIAALNGKKLHELVRDGSKKLASVPSGGKNTLTHPKDSRFYLTFEFV